MPYLVESVVSSGSTVPLYLFCGATMAAVSGMGAAFAILPAYEADLFGTKYVSAVHGRMLMFSSCAGVVGEYFNYVLVCYFLTKFYRSVHAIETSRNL